MKRERDSQRQKVYNGERALHARYPVLDNWSEVEAFAKKVVESAYVANKYGSLYVRNLRVERGRGGGRAYVMNVPVIDLGVWARRKSVILHEIAHHLNRANRPAASHGWQFCAIYLDLVRHFLGKDAAAVLKSGFKAHRVRFTAPRAKREISPEQRAVLVERMAKARAARAAKSAT